MRVAVVGSGIAGLTAACLLAPRHRVTLYEASARAGGHTNTVAVREQGRSVGVDTGFIVFNEPNYPRLCRLLERYRVAARDSDMSFSVHSEDGRFAWNGSFEALLGRPRNLASPRFLRMLADILRFHREAPRALANGLDDRLTVAAFAARGGYGEPFMERYLVPLGASLWSADARRFRDFPVRFVIEFLRNHGMLQVRGRPRWKTVAGGSSQYVRRMTAELGERLRLACPVRSVRRVPRGVELELAGGARERFDEAILACHADQSLALLRDPEDEEREVLACFPYRTNEVVLHCDRSLLPAEARVRASWNYRVPVRERDRVTVTYDMNRLQGLDSARRYLVSLNQSGAIAPERVLRRIHYRHPLFTPGRAAAQGAHGALIRRRGVSLCGAYWGYGFHEDGVASALAVTEAFGVGLDSHA